MQEVTCYRCRYVANLTPDAAKCPRCSTDLRTLIPPDEARVWFHDRAINFANRHEGHLALAEVKRGIAYAESSELRLLAAIIARQLGDYEEMRQHLAVIPLGDRLRDEAEWLLRSQQRATVKPMPSKNKGSVSPEVSPVISPLGATTGNSYAKAAVRSSEKNQWAKSETGGANTRANTSTYSSPSNHNRGMPIGGQPTTSGGMAATMTLGLDEGAGLLVQDAVRNRLSPALALLFCGAIGVLVWSLMQQGPITLDVLPTPFPAVTSLATPNQGAPISLPTATPIGEQNSVPGTDGALEITPSPTESIPSDVVQNGGEPVQVAATNPAIGTELSTSFNLLPYLVELGREDLAKLPIEARKRQTTLLLSGEVPSTANRTAIIEAGQTLAGITEVDAVGLLVRVPPTYVVQAGDNLWLIAYKFYGNEARRVEQIFALNTDILPSAEFLRAGMELKLPKMEE